ncbi:beta-galactosidase [Pontiella agarivorans]|uniref:Beta-galactosidase n=1 Tax=Pontiella agarivorans TaxID=3038953 RepID=A0ABU5MU14_9BACT|nr:beta-galactosidase [Pontiella agarivorans]MDZ8117699.1 beta-galactosidase [Pontiella agarivorans]
MNALFFQGAVAAGFILVTGCANHEAVPAEMTETRVLLDFENETLPESVKGEAVTFELTSGRGAGTGRQALEVVYPVESTYKKVVFEPQEPWDVSDLGDCALAVDIENRSGESVQLFMTLADTNQSVTAHANIAAGESGTFYYDIAGPNTELDLGMTGWPARAAGELRSENPEPFRYAWGARILDPAALKQVGFYQTGILNPRTLVFDNLRIVSNPHGNAAVLHPLVDEFGQYTGEDWPGKIHTEKELLENSKKEINTLANEKGMTGRSRFGGWAEGPKLEATGFFRTEKVSGKWALVDPDGYLFFAAGIANCRMSNTYTVTGVDYENTSDRAGAFVASALRRNMFAWLPERNDPLSDHYGYAGQMHTGPMKHGQTFSFYGANLQRKYGSDYREQWKTVTLDRMLNWGFTCFGNWTDPLFFGNRRVPYFAHAWIGGGHKRVSTGNDYWAPMHDPFDPEFTQSVRNSLTRLDGQIQDDPWCIGIFVENELSWGNENNDASRFGIVIHTLGRDAASCPAKAAFVDLLKTKYTSIDELNHAWDAKSESWDSFAAGFEHAGTLEGGRRSDFSMLSEALAEEYFRIVNRELKQLMPHHLFCGSRFADWGMTPEAVQAAVKHTDVVSYNLYKEGLTDSLRKVLAKMDRPSVIGEYHFGATDRGMFHGGIRTAANQKDRGLKYRNYMMSVIHDPCLVGAHWFQYVDSPTTGRAIDGENYNSGFVSVTDSPYIDLIDSVRELNRNIYTLRFSK